MISKAVREGSKQSVLHVVGGFHGRGAIENWLIRMLRHAKKRGIELDWTFYCEMGKGSMDIQARKLGAKVEYSPVPIGRVSLAKRLQFMRSLREELRHGKYDVLHSHHGIRSAVYLVSSLGLPLQQRIVHVHDADESVFSSSPAKQFVFKPLLRQICLTLSDRIVGVSEHTLETFLRGREPRPKDRIHYCGIDAVPFQNASEDRLSFRRDLGFPEDALILLFVGRMIRVKNPLFAVEVLAEMKRLDDRVCGVFAGVPRGGVAQEQEAADRACELGLDDSVRFLGWRDDVPDIMACCDWFIHPRLETEGVLHGSMEGLGLAIVEAQAAGLRLLVSQAVPPDAILPNASVAQLSLDAGPATWAQTAISQLNQPASSRDEAIACLRQSPFDMDYALDDMLRLYE